MAAHLDSLAEDACQVIDALAHERDSLLLQHNHAKLGQVGLEGDTGEGVLLGRLQHRLPLHAHVACKGLQRHNHGDVLFCLSADTVHFRR